MVLVSFVLIWRPLAAEMTNKYSNKYVFISTVKSFVSGMHKGNGCNTDMQCSLSVWKQVAKMFSQQTRLLL